MQRIFIVMTLDSSTSDADGDINRKSRDMCTTTLPGILPHSHFAFRSTTKADFIKLRDTERVFPVGHTVTVLIGILHSTSSVLMADGNPLNRDESKRPCCKAGTSI